MARVVLIPLILVASVSIFAAFGESGPGFTPATTISNIGQNSTSPQLIVSGNNIYAAWISDTSTGFGVLFTKSSDSGATFEKPQSLENAPSGAADNVRIIKSGDEIYAIWQSFLGDKSKIFFSKSADNGDSFSSPMTISNATKDSAFPNIAVSGGNVYAVWLEKSTGDITNVLFAKSVDDGKTFDNPIEITRHSGNSGLPKIATDGNKVYLLWEDNSPGNFDIFLAKSVDNGSTFGIPVNISGNQGDSGTPEMILNNGKMYVTWMDDTGGNFEVLFSKSSDDGKTFSTPVNLSKNGEDSGYPQFAVSGEKIYVTWTNLISDKNYDVFFAKSNDDGNTFEDPVNVSQNIGASGWPQISTDGGLYISWVDNTPGNYDIYITKSSDDGKTFQTPLDINSGTSGSWYNRMAVSSGTIYLVWQETEQNYQDIMFSKSTTFVPEFGLVAPAMLVMAIIFIVTLSVRSSLRFHL